MSTRSVLVLACTAAFICLVNRSVARGTNVAPQGAVFTLTEENDLVVRTDRHYTQGLRLSLLSKDDTPESLHRCFRDFFPLGLDVDAQKFGMAIGQQIFTPKNKSATAVVKTDRPYAGWLYLGGIWQRRGTSWADTPTLDQVELDLGVIGPDSFAREAQTTVHEWRGFSVPKGWKNQLQDEPGAALKVVRQWRIEWRSESLGADLIPELGGSLGNVGTYASACTTLRIGYHLPEDFGVQRIDSLASNSGGRISGKESHLGVYLFAGVEGRAVAYTAFLDGNFYQQSHRVDRETLVGNCRFGGVVAFRHCDVAYTYIFQSSEFVKQQDGDAFGSLSLNFKF